MLNVMIAGIGGASLGTEICKSLSLANRYNIFGCDISSTAYGLHDQLFAKTYLISKSNYVDNVIKSCKDSCSEWVIPGGEEPMVLLGKSNEKLKDNGIYLVSNHPQIIHLLSNKEATFNELDRLGINIPKTVVVNNTEDISFVGLPCVVKPSTGSGGSAMVFYAAKHDEAMIYVDYIRRNGSVPIAQEYISDEEGEFTIGVLSLRDQSIAGSVALRRELSAKLSISYKGRGGVISSGYSQGYIDNYPEICDQAEEIAKLIGSSGPINIQARIKQGAVYPFEINPRFSASTYLRALAGFNEVDIFIQQLSRGSYEYSKKLKTGNYLRSLTEQFVPKN